MIYYIILIVTKKEISGETSLLISLIIRMFAHGHFLRVSGFLFQEVRGLDSRRRTHPC
jgi:hypothetical protein